MPSTRSAGPVATTTSPRNIRPRTRRAQSAYLNRNNQPMKAPPKKRKRASPRSEESSECDQFEELVTLDNAMSSLDTGLMLSAEDFLPRPSGAVAPAPENINQIEHQSDDRLDQYQSSRPPGDLPTLSDYNLDETLLKWPKSRCKEVLAARKFQSNNQLSVPVKNEINSAFQRWEHVKMMLCLASNITLRMFNKQIGNISPTRKASSYVNFLQYSKINHTEPMPQPNSNDNDTVSQLVERNKRIGQAWTELTSDEKDVFSTRLLLALAGIPDLASEELPEDGNEGVESTNHAALLPEVTQLTSEEEELYRPLYEELVDHEVVVSKLGTAVPGVSDAKFTKRSLQCIQKLNQDMNAQAHRHEFQYWLVAASTVPPLTPGVSGWCKVFTSLPIMTKFVTAKANFPTIFGAVAQGKSVLNVVSQASGMNFIGPPRHSNLTDKEKQKCRRVLLESLVKVVGKKPRQGLPQGENPQAVFIQRGIPVRLELDDGASLTQADLMLGFLKMNAEGRRKWMWDLSNNKFRFVYDESRLEEAKTLGEFGPKSGKVSKFKSSTRKVILEDDSGTEEETEVSYEEDRDMTGDDHEDSEGSRTEGEGEAEDSDDVVQARNSEGGDGSKEYEEEERNSDEDSEEDGDSNQEQGGPKSTNMRNVEIEAEQGSRENLRQTMESERTNSGGVKASRLGSLLRSIGQSMVH